MIERHVEIPSRNGPIPTFAVCPDGPGSYPGIILYMDAPGIREELHNLARRIAKHGYFCALPDMYYRLGIAALQHGADAASRRLHADHVRGDELADQRSSSSTTPRRGSAGWTRRKKSRRDRWAASAIA